MPLDRLDKDKLYIQLTDILRENIRSGEWRVGRQIPTEEDLCKSFNVSKITVRRAITDLVTEGCLERLQGKGTFVRQGPPRAGMLMKTTLLESVFMPGDAEDVAVVEKRVAQSLPEDVMKRMGPVIDRDVFYICRLKSSEGVPVLVNEVYVPLRVCPAIKDWDQDSGPVFEFLREHASARIIRVVQEVEVGKPGEYHAGLLNYRAAGACMIIHRVFMAAGDMTLAYSRTTARGDRFRLGSEYFRMT